ncbi:hypothetical protein SK128_015441 [Halocaridina rubra]|uniref:ABC transmembrane type-1 domain-containing protein n=1 Tax=Halocaridina rubra TaxID=373956 RepID=A0AAN8X6L4_HALRR
MMLVEATEKYSEAENLKGNETDCQSPRKELKYSRALKQIIPIRPSPKHEKRNVLPTRYAGFISFFSVGWLTSMMWKAFKQKLDPKEIWSLPREEGSEENSKRLERLWCEEISKAKIDNRDPELWRAVWRFCRTRVIVNQILIIIIDVLFFSGSLLYTKKILEYIDDMTVDIRYGTMLIVGKLFLCTLFPIFLFSAAYLIGIHTSSRLTGALQALMYKKTLTLKTGGENLSAQVVNICSNDMERIFEASVSGTFLVDVPFTYSFCLMYSVYVFGPWSLVGFGIYFLFYPITKDCYKVCYQTSNGVLMKGVEFAGTTKHRRQFCEVQFTT